MERERYRREIERAILVNHPRPLSDVFDEDDLTKHARLVKGGQPTAQDCFGRALRLLKKDFVGEPGSAEEMYVEVNSFTPWENYGDRLLGSLQFCRTIVLHVENDQNDKPGIVTVGSLTGATFVFRVPEYDEVNGWSCFSRAFPRVARLMTNKWYQKLTSSWAATKKLFKHSGLDEDDEVVDATMLDDDMDEALLNVDCERLRTQYMIWKTIGRQSGPVWVDVWRHVKGRHQYPHPRHPDVLLDWDGARRTGRLSPAQKTYVQQAVRSAGIQATCRTIKQCVELQHAEDAPDLLRQSVTRTKVDEILTVQDVRAIVDEASAEAARMVDEKNRGSPVSGTERKRDARPVDDEQQGAVKKVHYIRPHEPHKPNPTPIAKPPIKPPTQSHTKPDSPFHNNNQKAFENPLKFLEDYDAHVQHNKRVAINKARAEFKANNKDKFKEDFLGKGCCPRCGDDKPHDDPMECVVNYYLRYKRLPRQCTVPCIYCSDTFHATDACVFIHVKCKKCRRRGHMQHECHLRTPLEWMLVYLDCCHLGKLTRENVDGPLGGRFGFGDVTGMDIPPAVWEYVAQKRESLKRARKRYEQGIGTAGHARESLVGWTLLTQELKRLDLEKKKFQDEKERFYEKQRAWELTKRGERVVEVDEDDEDGLVM